MRKAELLSELNAHLARQFASGKKVVRVINLVGISAGHPEPVFDVVRGLLLTERLQVKAQSRTLRQLLHLRCVQCRIEFRLTGENDAQNLILCVLHTGQQAAFPD